MRFGATRYGPCAPCAFQFGKYEVFTRIGLPTSETWNEIVSTFSCTSVTRAGVIGVSVVCASRLMSTRFQLFGPDATQTLSSTARSMNHGAAEHSHAPSVGTGLPPFHGWCQHCW